MGKELDRKNKINADGAFSAALKGIKAPSFSVFDIERKERGEKRRNTLTLGVSCDKIFSIIWLCKTQP